MCNLLHAIIECNLLHAINCTCNHVYNNCTVILAPLQEIACNKLHTINCTCNHGLSDDLTSYVWLHISVHSNCGSTLLHLLTALNILLLITFSVCIIITRMPQNLPVRSDCWCQLLWREYISSTHSYFLVLALDHSTHDVFYCSYAKYYYDVASIVKNYNCASYSDNYIKR